MIAERRTKLEESLCHSAFIVSQVAPHYTAGLAEAQAARWSLVNSHESWVNRKENAVTTSPHQ
jgi:hypothetical protein